MGIQANATLSLDELTFGVPEVNSAKAFYESVYAPTAADRGASVGLDINGVGQVVLQGIDELAGAIDAKPETSGFRGYTVSVVVDQPGDVKSILEAAERNGASITKPAKKSLFAGFSGAYQAPDGVIWELASAKKKDDGPGGSAPSEIVAILGVDDPERSKTFYEALGMKVDHDYGSKFVDFELAAGKPRLAFMPRKALAKNAGVEQDGDGFRAVALTSRAGSPEEVDAVLEAAVAAGAKLAAPGADNGQGGYAGYFTDPDGFQWKVTTG